MANENIRRTFFIPKYWTLKDIMHPQQTLNELLLMLHDEEDSHNYNEEENEKWREDLLIFSDDLEQIATINRNSEGYIIFEIDLEGVPLGCLHEIDKTATLGEILEIAWDVAADCTLDSERWMSNWYVTHVVIKTETYSGNQDRIVLRCIREDRL